MCLCVGVLAPASSHARTHTRYVADRQTNRQIEKQEGRKNKQIYTDEGKQLRRRGWGACVCVCVRQGVVGMGAKKCSKYSKGSSRPLSPQSTAERCCDHELCGRWGSVECRQPTLVLIRTTPIASSSISPRPIVPFLLPFDPSVIQKNPT